MSTPQKIKKTITKYEIKQLSYVFETYFDDMALKLINANVIDKNHKITKSTIEDFKTPKHFMTYILSKLRNENEFKLNSIITKIKKIKPYSEIKSITTIQKLEQSHLFNVLMDIYSSSIQFNDKFSTQLLDKIEKENLLDFLNSYELFKNLNISMQKEKLEENLQIKDNKPSSIKI